MFHDSSDGLCTSLHTRSAEDSGFIATESLGFDHLRDVVDLPFVDTKVLVSAQER